MKEPNESLPLDYRIQEYLLAINRELYEKKIIDLEIFSEMETAIIRRMNKMKGN